MNVNLIGTIAATIVASCGLPQVIRVWRLKSAYEISMPFIVLLLVGISLYTGYFIHIGAKPAAIGHIVTLGITIALLVLKLKYGLRRKYGSKKKARPTIKTSLERDKEKVATAPS